MHTHTLWAAQVAAGTVLPDKRLQARLACILETFAERPNDAIPQAAGSWGQAKGVYRFLANPRVRSAAVHQGLTRDTARQCLEQRTVLVVQDTTSLNLTGCHVLPELGPIGSGNLAQGVLLHSTLALTDQGAMLGVLGLQTWARPAGNAPGPEAKESGKWLHGIDQARQVVWETAWAAGATAPPRLVMVELGTDFARQSMEAVMQSIAEMAQKGYDALVFSYEDHGNFKRQPGQCILIGAKFGAPARREDGQAAGNILFFRPHDTVFLAVALRALLGFLPPRERQQYRDDLQ